MLDENVAQVRQERESTTAALDSPHFHLPKKSPFSFLWIPGHTFCSFYLQSGRIAQPEILTSASRSPRTLMHLHTLFPPPLSLFPATGQVLLSDSHSLFCSPLFQLSDTRTMWQSSRCLIPAPPLRARLLDPVMGLQDMGKVKQTAADAHFSAADRHGLWSTRHAPALPSHCASNKFRLLMII